MKLVIGTYRQKTYIEDALTSIDRFVYGISELVFVDDSNNPEHSEWLRQYGRVIETHGRGYNAAMQAVVAELSGNYGMFWEEDFTALEPIFLDLMEEHLVTHPYLAQVALLRGPWFPIEHQHGGLIEALEAKGETFTLVDGVLEHTATFTCNPAVWSPVASMSWPVGNWSEEQKRLELIKAGYKFSHLPGIRVAHNGVRSGHGY